MLCIQEHWYFSYEKNDLINISNETQAKSVDDYTKKENFIHGRGYGGVAIFWRKDINHVIKSDDDGNGRINVITVNMKEHPLCIINVYMPSDNSNRDEQYKDILSHLEEMIDKFQCQYQILLCGDFNSYSVKSFLELMLYCFIMCRIKIKFSYLILIMRPFIETIDRETNACNSSWRTMV